MITRFFDMSSGGSEKTEFSVIYIEADKEKAKTIFASVFGRDPENTTCQCCGRDYSITEYGTIQGATEYERGSLSVEEYLAQPSVKFIRASDVQ